MILKTNENSIEVPDYNLNHLDIRQLDIQYNSMYCMDIFYEILKDLDCTREFSCGRPMMTTYPMYARNIAAFLYVLDKCKADLKKIDTNEWKNLLINIHIKNIKFEEENPYIEKNPVKNKKQKKKDKIIKYKTHDLLTNEETYLLLNTKTKKHVVSNDPNALNTKTKNRTVPLSIMKFKFNKNE